MLISSLKNKVIIFSVLVVCFLIISGCAQRRVAVQNKLIKTEPTNFILAQSNIVETTKIDNLVAEVTKSTLYSKMNGKIKSVAISAPSSCADQSASSATGTAENKGTLVKTNCGVEMAELERTLVGQGFTVYSWNLVKNTVNSNKNDTRTVAKQLGAQVLFQVNSLERVAVSPGRDAHIERNFFESNEFGDIINPVALDDDRINFIKNIISADEQNWFMSSKRLGAMLDVNAVDIETGQTIWFYRWSKHENTSQSIVTGYLLECSPHFNCRKVRAKGRSVKGGDGGKRSNETESFSSSARVASAPDVVYFGLLRDVTIDFVRRFSSDQ